MNPDTCGLGKFLEVSGYVWTGPQWAIFVAGARGSEARVFHCSAAWSSWQSVWWGVISFQNFRSLKRGLYFCVDFLAWSELIVYIDLPEYYEICAKMFLDYQCEKGCEAFLIFQILLLLSALVWRRLANIQFANIKIHFLVNQSEYRKSLTSFCNLSATDSHCAPCFVVLASSKAGNPVKQIVSVLRLKACTRLPLNQIFKKIISFDSTFD